MPPCGFDKCNNERRNKVNKIDKDGEPMSSGFMESFHFGFYIILGIFMLYICSVGEKERSKSERQYNGWFDQNFSQYPNYIKDNKIWRDSTNIGDKHWRNVGSLERGYMIFLMLIKMEELQLKN